MADTLALDLAASVAWQFKEALDLSNVLDNNKLEFTATLADGTGASQVDKIWHDQRAIAAGLSDDLDLTALTTTIFGSVVTQNILKPTVILLVNTNTVAGDYLQLDSSVTNGYTGFFSASATSKVKVGPNSALHLSDVVDTFGATDATHKVIRITNPSANSVTYNIVIAGRSA